LRLAGFTIIELIVAMVLLAAIAAIAISQIYKSRSRVYIAVLQADLKNLATAQETFFVSSDGYFGEDGESEYARSIEQLQFQPSEGVTIKLRSNQSGWTAQAEHGRLRDAKVGCAIYMGDVPSPYKPSVHEGMVECGSLTGQGNGGGDDRGNRRDRGDRRDRRDDRGRGPPTSVTQAAPPLR
jgi:prepilin-type N-terminal cleavage/methylation domain-containing protein